MMRTEDTGVIHVIPDDDYRKHITVDTLCGCDPFKTEGGNVIIHRHFKE